MVKKLQYKLSILKKYEIKSKEIKSIDIRNIRKGYWRISNSQILNTTLIKKHFDDADKIILFSS